MGQGITPYDCQFYQYTSSYLFVELSKPPPTSKRDPYESTLLDQATNHNLWKPKLCQEKQVNPSDINRIRLGLLGNPKDIQITQIRYTDHWIQRVCFKSLTFR